MKTLFVSTLFLFSTLLCSAQECSKFYPLKEGVVMEYTSYDKKGKEMTTVSAEVTEVKEENGMQVATLSSDVEMDKKGETTTMTYDITCDGDKVSIDFNSMLSSPMFSQYQDMDVEVSGTDIDLPNNLNVGDKLPDANMKISIDMAGVGMNMTSDITDRTVVGEESITTPAGTFDCYVISYTNKFKMGMSRESSAKQWIAEGVGLVKQEDYNKKGKLASSTVLTGFSE